VSTAPRSKSIDDVLGEFAQHRKVMQDELQKVIVGQNEVIEQLFAAIFTRGHCLLEGVPGLAKTLMVATLARILDVGFKRVQFTPDLMPSDITGTNVLEEDEAGRRRFRFVEGPIFTNILLADEINRTPPKTQAALLQAMQEREVSVGQETHSLPDPFFTIATQNPIEQEGTYPLPEAQLDRFMFNIKVGYPTASEEEQILMATTRAEKPEVRKVLSGRAIVNIQKLVGSVAVSEYVVKYVARLVRATRPKDPQAPAYVAELVDWGAGPRAGQFLIQGEKTRSRRPDTPRIPALIALPHPHASANDALSSLALPMPRHIADIALPLILLPTPAPHSQAPYPATSAPAIAADAHPAPVRSPAAWPSDAASAILASR
jgi:MoxR-like ATPase